MSFDDSGHWYWRSGDSAHELPLKSDPSRMKKTTLADAKKLGLCPSVTTILKAKSSHALEAWRQRMVIEACYNNKESNLPIDQWSGMVKEEAFEIVGRSADEGTQYHLVVESVVNNAELPDYELSIPSEFFGGFCEWWGGLGITCSETEVGFAHPLGYGGRMDFVGYDADDRDVFIDWKTQNTAGKKSAGFYRDSQPVQLAAYMEGYRHKIAQDMLFLYLPRMISVVISRDEPGRVEHKEWEDHGAYWQAFKDLFGWWKYDKQYDPSWEG